MTWVSIAPAKTPRRYKQIDIDPRVIASWLGRGFDRARPVEVIDDLEIVGVEWVPEFGALRFVVESETFDVVKEQSQVEHLSPEFVTSTPLDDLAREWGITPGHLADLLEKDAEHRGAPHPQRHAARVYESDREGGS